jgi:ribosomal protein L11 methylase PrmA
MEGVDGSSFRDPGGFVFVKDGEVYRQVNKKYAENYGLLMSSGLYDVLAGGGMMVTHGEADLRLAPDPGQAHKILKPEKIPFISYPYEWSFSRLKDAALLTLRVHRAAIEHGMTLKDASAYNIQFKGPSPILIDTLSFKEYRQGEPWAAYAQFCGHFLAPLALMCHTDIRLPELLITNIDGIPLDLASRLLPVSTWLNLPLLTNIHLHARSIKRYAGRGLNALKIKGGINKFGMLAIIDGLETAVRELTWRPRGTEWAGYYDRTNYSHEAFADKKSAVSAMLGRIRAAGGIAWDLGANEGVFSALAAEAGFYTAAFDFDPAAVEKHYLAAKNSGLKNVLPLVADLKNPPPAIGWKNRERKSLIERGPADVALALALVHHLAISNNTPLSEIASFMAGICRHLIIEFVPKTDSQAARLLASREDIFDRYDRGNFELEFKRVFEILETRAIKGTERVLYLMRNRNNY